MVPPAVLFTAQLNKYYWLRSPPSESSSSGEASRPNVGYGKGAKMHGES